MSKRWIAPVVSSFAAGLVLAFGPWACADLPPVATNQCGNAIVELPNNEDCDTFGVALDGGVSDAGNACSSTCRVQCGDAGACPWGWGCGTDLLCRRPSGVFAAVSTEVHENVKGLQLADVDGDGYDEILVDTGEQLAVHYLDDESAVSQTIAITASSPSPAVGDFDGDGIPDIAYRLETSVEVLLGARDRTLAPAPFPLPLPGPMPPDLRLQTGQRLMIITTSGIDASAYKLRELLRLDQDSVTTFLPSATGASSMDPITLAKTGWSTLPPSSAPVPVGKFDESSPCDQFVLASTNGGVGVYYACLPGGLWNDQAKPLTATPPTMVTIADGTVPAGPVFALDVDGDGHLDLAIVTNNSSGTAAEIAVAYGDGAGRFGSTRIMGLGWPADGKAAPHLCLSDMHILPVDPNFAGCETAPVLAVADFNGDRVLDLVNACGVFLAPPDPLAACGLASAFAPMAAAGGGLSQAKWSRAVVTDMNGDGVPDVAAATCEDTSITYLEGSTSLIFNTYTIPTLGGVEDLQVGDFDGDHIPDLAYVERSGDSPVCASASAPATPPALTETLGVIFGAASGGPSPPSLLATFSSPPPPAAPVQGIVQIAAGNITDVTGQFDLATDLAVASVDPENVTTFEHLEIFPGSTSREIVAPYFLVSPAGNHDGNIPWLLAMGHFADTKAAMDLAVLSADGNTANLWGLTPDDGTYDVASFFPMVSGIDPTQYATAGSPSAGWVKPINLGGSNDVVVFLSAKQGASTSDLYLASLASGAWTVTSVSPPLPGAYRGPIAKGDVDGQSGDDLVLTSPEGVIVIWNEGNGALNVGGATTITAKDLQAAACASPPPGNVVAAAVVGAAPGPSKQIVILTDHHGYLASLDPASPSSHHFTATCLDASLPPPPPPGGFTGAVIAAGDVDGDGVEDLVLGHADRLQIFHGKPVVQ